MSRMSLQWKAIEPTVFFVRTAQGLRQAVDLTIRNAAEAVEGSVAIKFGSQEERVDIGKVEAGEGTYRVYIPDIREPLPASTSFCGVDQPNVSLLTLKQAEDGNGIIVRLIETEGRDVKTTITLPFLTIVQAYETNLVEENQKLLTFARHIIEALVKAFGITTIRIQSA